MEGIAVIVCYRVAERGGVKMQRNISILVRLLFVVCLVGFLNPLVADVIDEFDSPELNPELWEMKEVGKASHTIKGGMLTMESPDVSSGSALYHPRNIADMEINFEVKLDTTNIGDHIVLGSIALFEEPQENLKIGFNWLALYLLVPGKAILKQDPDEPAEEAYFLNFNGNSWHAGDDFNSPKMNDTAWHHVAVTFDPASGTIKSCVDGDCNEHKTNDILVSKGEGPLWIGNARFVETNTDFSYNGAIDEVAIFNVALTEADIKDLMKGSIAAVSPAGKLATTWGSIKAH